MSSDEREVSVSHRINERRLLRLVTPKVGARETSPRLQGTVRTTVTQQNFRKTLTRVYRDSDSSLAQVAKNVAVSPSWLQWWITIDDCKFANPSLAANAFDALREANNRIKLGGPAAGDPGDASRCLGEGPAVSGVGSWPIRGDAADGWPPPIQTTAPSTWG